MSILSLRDLWYAAGLSAVLVAAILVCVAAYQFLIEPSLKRRKVNRRLKEGHQKELRRIQILKELSGEPTGQWQFPIRIIGKHRFATLKSRMQQADIQQDPGTFLRRSSYLVLLGVVAGTWGTGTITAGLLLGAALGVLPFLYIGWKRRSKTRKFEQQMPDAMELLARSLRAGHTLPSAIELVGKEMPDPMGNEMTIAHEEQQYGISNSDALLHMLERVESVDLRYFTAAVLIQQETGGNLAELMENIARVIRSRLNFKSKVKSLTAMARSSTTIMIITPILAFLGLMLIAHQYEKALVVTPIGRIMIVTGIVLIAIGTFVLRRMIQSVES
jgi:tight adherence protein B